jgi:hypothetical protein
MDRGPCASGQTSGVRGNLRGQCPLLPSGGNQQYLNVRKSPSYFLVVLGMELRPLHMVAKLSTTDLDSHSKGSVFILQCFF